LTAEESPLFDGKKALTKKTYTTDGDETKRICEAHLQEFEDLIQAARGARARTVRAQIRRPFTSPDGGSPKPLSRRRLERSVPRPTKTRERAGLPFDVLLATWELENTNTRTRGTKRRCMRSRRVRQK